MTPIRLVFPGFPLVLTIFPFPCLFLFLRLLPSSLPCFLFFLSLPLCAVFLLVTNAFQEHRGLLRINYPMEHGIVEDWADMETLWHYIYSKEQLDVSSEGQLFSRASPGRADSDWQ